ncbi:MAG: hypothetical protein KDC27_15690 [Acidobacteria bacterium]|nr:hypothetical protein [Acidobacteriota bacterium]
MKSELRRIVADADLGLLWQSSSERPSEVNGRTVSVALTGRCFGGPPARYESGPLGWTKTINGRVLPFVEISCGRIASLLEPALRSEPQAVRDLFFGKALGRVLGHELAHALSRTHHHASEGLCKAALSPRDLMQSHYQLARADFAAAPLVRPNRAQQRQVAQNAPEPAELPDPPTSGDGLGR